MDQRKDSFKQNESGVIMIEATIVVIITIIVLLGMLALGFMIYQQAMVNTIACELSSSIADSFKYDDRATFSMNDIDNNAINGVEKYRATFMKGKMEGRLHTIANDYGKKRMVAASFGFNAETPVIEAKLKANGVGRLRVEVMVSQRCDILFDRVLMYFGIIDGPLTFKAYATAECMDITGYAGNVQFMNYVGKEVADIGGDFTKIIDLVITVKNTFFGG